MTRNRVLYLILVIILAGGSAVSGAAVGGIVVYRAMSQIQAASPTPVVQAVPASSSQQIIVNNSDVETTITQAVQKVGPAVVTVVGAVPGQMTFWGPTGDQTVSGSGVFISDQGYVLTNNHVVEGAKSLTIVLSDGTEQKATLIGADQYSDIAVLKTEAEAPAVASLGNSDALKPGETVIAIGSPLGDFKNTVTVGVVSATGRSIDNGNGYQIEDLIQTDAAINQGNSGGPLVNLAGEVIAINTLIVRNSGSGVVAEGLGFAIPINTAQAVAMQIIEHGYISRPYMGISFQAVTPDIASAYNLPVQWGVYVTKVNLNSPADKAGLQRGDIITSIGGVALDATHSYINTLFNYKPGDQVTVEFVRNGQTRQAQVTLGESSPSS